MGIQEIMYHLFHYALLHEAEDKGTYTCIIDFILFTVVCN